MMRFMGSPLPLYTPYVLYLNLHQSQDRTLNAPSPQTKAFLNIARVEMGWSGTGRGVGVKKGKRVGKEQRKTARDIIHGQ